MSTKALRRAIELLKGGRSSEEWKAGRDAEAELEAIEKAAKDVLNEEMESADSAAAREGMKRYESACTLFASIASEA